MCDLFPATVPSSAHTADSLLLYFSYHGVVHTWVSDQGSHFLNQVIAELSLLLRSKHHFHIANCPWTHASIENCNRQVLNVFRSLCSELRVTRQQWPLLIPLVRYALNNAISPDSNYAPITLHTGAPPSSPLDAIWSPGARTFITVPLSKEQLDHHVSDLQSSLRDMHREITAVRQKSHDRANRKRRAPYARFSVGDYVLYSTPFKSRQKLMNKWHGPARVVECLSDFVFRIEDLVSKNQLDVHSQRLQFYSDNSLHITSELLKHIAAESAVYEVEAILDAKLERRHWQLLVRWRGFTELEDSWEDAKSLQNDIPAHLKKLLLQATFPNAERVLKDLFP